MSSYTFGHATARATIKTVEAVGFGTGYVVGTTEKAGKAVASAVKGFRAGFRDAFAMRRTNSGLPLPR